MSGDRPAADLNNRQDKRIPLLSKLAEEPRSPTGFQRALQLYHETTDLEGIDLLNVIVRENIDNWIGEEAFARLADSDIEHDSPDDSKRRLFYRSYVDAVPNSLMAVEAVQRLVASIHSEEGTDQALAITQEIGDSHPGSLAFYAASALRGDLLSEVGNVPGALNAYLQVYLECERLGHTQQLRGRLARTFERSGMRWEAAVFRATPQTSFASSEVAQFYWDSLAWLREEKGSETGNWKTLWEASGDPEALLGLCRAYPNTRLGLYASLYRVSALLAGRSSLPIVEEVDNFASQCDGVLSRDDTAQPIMAECAYSAARVLLDKLIWHLSLPGRQYSSDTEAMRDSVGAIAALAVRICEAQSRSDETWRPRLMESILGRAQTWETLGMYDKAIEEYRQIEVHFDGEHIVYEAQMRIASIMAERWHALDSAIELYESVAKGEARPAVREEAFSMMLKCLVEKKRFGDVCLKAQQFEKLFPRSQRLAYVRTLRAGALLETGRTEEAITELRGVVRDHPDSTAAPRAQFMLGLAYARSNMHDEASEVFQDLVRRWPNAYGTNLAVEYLEERAK